MLTENSPGAAGRPIDIQVHRAMAEVSRTAWDSLLSPDAAPFLEWHFLDALETSGSAVPERGWTPLHFTAWRGGQLVGAMPGYVKTHSMGEFMYNDFRWAAFTPRFKVAYYPKLILGVAFSPATGPRPLVASGVDRAEVTRAIATAAQAVAIEEGYSSVNVLFSRRDDLPEWRAAGFAAGGGMQFHWGNAGFSSFDDFLKRFNSKRRHMIKSERAQLAKDGTQVQSFTGSALTPELLAFASKCYESTFDRHAWNDPHLTPAFFKQARERFPERVDVVLASESGRWLASALNLRGQNRLFGRHWGAVEDRRYLHFNVCYYHSIERSIVEGLQVFEPGAGGEHKMARGFEPTLMHSAHWFANERLHQAMSTYLAQEVSAYTTHVAEARASGAAFKGGTSGE
jgi:predicted N-acyltransferase